MIRYYFHRESNMCSIQYASDLHLDEMKFYNLSKLIIPCAEVLILGGDICNIVNVNNHISFFEYVSENFQYVLYIPGNHEFYNNQNFSIENLEYYLENFLKKFKNIIYLNNKSVFIEDILFSGSCLWCNPVVSPPPWFKLDITCEQIRNMHQSSINYLNKVSTLKHDKHVIISHYPPRNFKEKFFNIYDSYYRNYNINLENMPKVWIFGHIHKNTDIFIDETRYLSNQRKDKKYSNSIVFTI